MKKIYCCIFLLLAVSAVSCTKNEIDEARIAPDGEKLVLTVNYDSPVRTSLGDDLFPVWNEGDEIWLSDGVGTAKGVVTAEYAGKSFAEIEVSGLDASKKIYAAYPYSEKHRISGGEMRMHLPSLQDGTFASANLVGGSCAAGEKAIALHNVTAILKFSFLREDLSCMEIAGDGSQLTSCGDRIHTDLTSGHGTRYLACWPSTLVSGTGISFVSKDGRMGCIETGNANKLDAGVIYDMGEIDNMIIFDSTPATDLSAAETANCYIVSAPGTYRIRTCRGNSSVLLDGPCSSSLLWETVNTAEAPKIHSLVSETAYDNGFLYFRIPEDAPDGNALVSVRDGNGANLWSWHLWLLKDGIKDQQWSDGANSFSGAVMLDRNLGALTPDLSLSSFGLLYQWGRKDPFIGYKASQTGIAVTYTDISEETGNVGYTTVNPTEFIIGGTDWLTEPDYSLWTASDKTVYDPCPAGYHVPYQSVFNGISTSNTTRHNTDPDYGYRTVMGSEYICFPSAGLRDYNDGHIFNSKSSGYYWCESKAFRLKNGEIQFNNSYRGYAASVRCQKNNTGDVTSLKVKINTTMDNLTVSAPRVSGNGYPSASVIWGDGSEEEALSLTTGNAHTYVSAGEYSISITGFSISTFKISSLGNVTEVDLSNFK